MPPRPPRPRSRRRLVWAGGAVLLLLLVAGGAALLLKGSTPKDVNHPGVEFSAKPQPTTTPAAPRPVTGAARDPLFDWPVYGYAKQRTGTLALADPTTLHPPFSQRWALTGKVLLEFPPVLSGRSLFLLKNNGALYGVSRRTGRVLWKRKLGSLAASSPAAAHNTVFAALLQRFDGSKGGRVVAVSARDGRTRWSRKLPSRAESSPLLDRGKLYFGSEDGTVYALNASDGSVIWKRDVGGAVKAGLATDGAGTLYAASYGGTLTALRMRDGAQVWKASTSGRSFGRSGNFYSTPAVAYDRVYLGNTDGFVYSFGAASGKLAWRHRTGGLVYSSPAVTQVPRGRPTVYIGSYDKTLYALDARTGRPRWTRKVGGRISGGVVVLGDLVFLSTLAKTTMAVGARTGTPVWSTPRGAFNPGVSDGRRFYLVGYSSLFALTPQRLLKSSRVVRRYGCLRHRGRLCVRYAHHKPIRDKPCTKKQRGLCVRYGYPPPRKQ